MISWASFKFNDEILICAMRSLAKLISDEDVESLSAPKKYNTSDR